jgi:hypothetical protein
MFGDLDILSFVRISWLKWVGHVNRMENKRTVSQIIIPKEVDQEDDQETDGGIVYKQTLRSVKLTTGMKGKKIELTGKRPLRRRRSALDCSATEEEEEEERSVRSLVYVPTTLTYFSLVCSSPGG